MSDREEIGNREPQEKRFFARIFSSDRFLFISVLLTTILFATTSSYIVSFQARNYRMNQIDVFRQAIIKETANERAESILDE
ncbi:MAG: hypothetical protein AAGJ87_06160, partial [Pseudomonadota bacterium]